MAKKYPVELEGIAARLSVEKDIDFERAKEHVRKQYDKAMRQKEDASKSSTAQYQ